MKTFTKVLCVLLMVSFMVATACSKAKPKVEEPVTEVKTLAQDLLANLTQIDSAMATQIAAQANDPENTNNTTESPKSYLSSLVYLSAGLVAFIILWLIIEMASLRVERKRA